ncbi:hypothetical protein TTHERM_00361330 (macronuclear) [Tetrahymena thermophila SB210]|uniref:Uncharacterized protein n=1 Tax=Tetrahymena thermophila (strain SB210) TaxID=312017 RepID=Q22PL1_TETTS|nr:hypothetical protein TTHERM_00361330 [Tetrahymena thermophila SB210]EAR87098.1 hypothetical protein TTHERM_00361330 [Tetrahymena thermophila SB210]|eukprot:XP_001007343.1 hypothetical protein TTHERM_00361330 [Tetrahymena thermophila SB210]
MEYYDQSLESFQKQYLLNHKTIKSLKQEIYTYFQENLNLVHNFEDANYGDCLQFYVISINQDKIQIKLNLISPIIQKQSFEQDNQQVDKYESENQNESESEEDNEDYNQIEEENENDFEEVENESQTENESEVEEQEESEIQIEIKEDNEDENANEVGEKENQNEVEEQEQEESEIQIEMKEENKLEVDGENDIEDEDKNENNYCKKQFIFKSIIQK